jgi:thiamine-phosphate pyrophosphorylase
VRLHAVVDSVAAAERAVADGATVIQVRLKNVTTAERAATGRLVRPLPAILVINDDVEAALLCAADGVHLGQGDTGADRALATGLLLGISVADVAEAERAVRAGADYLGAGPVWTTPSKPDAVPAIGLDGLAAICEVSSVPVVAIGGVDAHNAAACIAAGAAGVAVVRAAADAARVRAAVEGALAVSP